MTVSQYLTETRIFAGVCLYSSLQRRVNIDINEAVDTGIQGGEDWMTGKASNGFLLGFLRKSYWSKEIPSLY